jgi:hypothetical protein
VDEGRIWEEVGIQGVFLVGWRALCQEVDDIRNLSLYEGIELAAGPLL